MWARVHAVRRVRAPTELLGGCQHVRGGHQPTSSGHFRTRTNRADRGERLNSRGSGRIAHAVRCHVFACPRLPFLPEIVHAPQKTQRDPAEKSNLAAYTPRRIPARRRRHPPRPGCVPLACRAVARRHRHHACRNSMTRRRQSPGIDGPRACNSGQVTPPPDGHAAQTAAAGWLGGSVWGLVRCRHAQWDVIPRTHRRAHALMRDTGACM
jgi:hypothetical protein